MMITMSVSARAVDRTLRNNFLFIALEKNNRNIYMMYDKTGDPMMQKSSIDFHNVGHHSALFAFTMSMLTATLGFSLE